MTDERKQAEEILQRYIVIYNPSETEPYYIKSDVVKAMEAYAALKVAEAMPTEEDIKKRQKDRGDYMRELGYSPHVIAKYKDAIKETAEWFSNRMGGKEK